jgi:phosphatidylinositol alpha-1,6-mannosyltransferase
MCFTMQRADWILSNSDNTRDTLVNLLGVNPDRIALTYPTVDEERFHPSPLDEELRRSVGVTGDKKLILSVGRLMRRKGFDNVIRSLPMLLEKGLDIEYALIGIGEELTYLKELASEFNVTERVHFLGHVSYEDLPRWYHACDLFVMPNRDIGGDSEGFGLVFLEAAASGKPAIAGKAGGTGSAVIDNETGLRVDGENIEDIVTAIGDILFDLEKSSRMGHAARQRVLESFVHERRVDQLRDLAFRKR